MAETLPMKTAPHSEFQHRRATLLQLEPNHSTEECPEIEIVEGVASIQMQFLMKHSSFGKVSWLVTSLGVRPM
ncbi:BnaCnng11550D [Brassica napus]|uniref:BnaCnng11550D protein n=2 Tax=Brassica TaxID=3705 RepID=A0A078I406_BRANA|nr:BnaCnng11550D [Brassica napus]